MTLHGGASSAYLTEFLIAVARDRQLLFDEVRIRSDPRQ
jgi:hypothetical protein